MSRPVERPAIVAAIDALLSARRADRTICPSEVARALAGDDGAWRALMPRIREVAAGLVAEGRLTVTRRGQPVDATAPGGPIRLGRPEAFEPTDPPSASDQE